MPRARAARKLQPTNEAGSASRLFPERLQIAMKERGWSRAETARRVREQLGDGAKFTPANIAHYVNGRSHPRARYLAVLSEVLGKPEAYFARNDSKAESSATQTIMATDTVEVDSAPATLDRQPELPPLHIEDRGGQAWLQINQQVPWPVAVKILQALKADVDSSREPTLNALRR